MHHGASFPHSRGGTQDAPAKANGKLAVEKKKQENKELARIMLM
jgi:hypothetical protein